MILQFELYKFWKTYKEPRGVISYSTFLDSLRTDAKYAAQVHQFICDNRSRPVKERVCLSPSLSSK